MGDETGKTEELGEYITLTRAAEIAGYRGGAGNLRRAAAQGTLRTVLIGRTRLTTPSWLNAYTDGLKPTAGWPRGQARKDPYSGLITEKISENDERAGQ